MPGPLFAVTVSETPRRVWLTGPVLVAGYGAGYLVQSMEIDLGVIVFFYRTHFRRLYLVFFLSFFLSSEIKDALQYTAFRFKIRDISIHPCNTWKETEVDSP